VTFKAVDDLAVMLAVYPAAVPAAVETILATYPSRGASLRLLARRLRVDGRRSDAAALDDAMLAAAARVPAVAGAIRAFVAGRHGEAERLVRDVLAERRENIAATLLLAEIAAASGYDDEAVALYRTALALAPDNYETKAKLANAQFRLNDVVAALATIDELVLERPDDVASILLRLTMLAQIGEYDEAERGYEAALSRHQDAVKLWVGYGHLLRTAGKIAESAAAYRRALTLPSPAEAWWGLADLKSGLLRQQDVARIETALNDHDLPPQQAMHLHFAAGKAKEDAAEYRASFDHYAKANAIIAALNPHNAAAESAEIDHAMRLFDADFFARRRPAGCTSRAPIFILGMPRAGSTLIEQILSSHSEIEGTAELPYISLLAHRLLSGGRSNEARYPDVLTALDPAALSSMGESYLQSAAIHRKTDRPFFIDKLPENWLHLGLIHLILPNAIIIDARRDAMACGFSNFKQHYANGRSFASSLEGIGGYYRQYVRLTAHFDSVLPGRVYRVQHEALLANTEGEVRRLLDHIGLAFEPACLRFYENRRAVRTASAAQVRRPIDQRSGDAWQHYRTWLEPLTEALGQLAD
jgi:Tfp pilus assembly protein PilF